VWFVPKDSSFMGQGPFSRVPSPLKENLSYSQKELRRALATMSRAPDSS
jgi:hypothetical protein